jgi:hypothetical protein
MRGRPWLVSGVVMLLMAAAVAALITTATHGLLNAPPMPPVPAHSDPLPQALADEIKRYEQASYLLGIHDAVAFWHLTGVVPDTPARREALWARHQVSSNPLTAPEAQAMLQPVTPEGAP